MDLDYTVFHLMLTTENCVEHMMNHFEPYKGKTALKDQYVDHFMDYFFVAISKIKVQCCSYQVKLHIFVGSANLGNKAKDMFV
jgi:hypothetical protein